MIECRSEGCCNNLIDGEPLIWLEVAFTAKPVLHRGLQAIERDVVAGFKQSVGSGQRIVEDRIVGEVAHGEVVDPSDGARMRQTSRVDSLNGKPAHEHRFTLMEQRRARLTGRHKCCPARSQRASPARLGNSAGAARSGIGPLAVCGRSRNREETIPQGLKPPMIPEVLRHD